MAKAINILSRYLAVTMPYFCHIEAAEIWAPVSYRSEPKSPPSLCKTPAEPFCDWQWLKACSDSFKGHQIYTWTNGYTMTPSSSYSKRKRKSFSVFTGKTFCGDSKFLVKAAVSFITIYSTISRNAKDLSIVQLNPKLTNLGHHITTCPSKCSH